MSSLCRTIKRRMMFKRMSKQQKNQKKKLRRLDNGK